MKIQLLSQTDEMDWTPCGDRALWQDLELEPLLQIMADGQAAADAVCRTVLHRGCGSPAEIVYRQEIFQNFRACPEILSALQALPDQVAQRKKDTQQAVLLLDYPTSRLQHALELLQIHLEALENLRDVAARERVRAQAPGLRQFLDRVLDRLTDAFFEEAAREIRDCRFRGGYCAAATLGPGLKPTAYVPRQPRKNGLLGLRAMLSREKRYTFSIADNDNNGAKALMELQQRSTEAVAGAMMQAADGMDAFWQELDRELTFYAGGLRLTAALEKLDCPWCLPTLSDRGGWAYEGLCDSALALARGEPVVGNDHDLGDPACVMITGANQGGKTTYLRALGQALVLGSSGLPVPARQFGGPFCRGVFTHFRKEEDRTLHSGKLEEELQRMDGLIDHLVPGSVLLMNESFAATNEEDGTALCLQVMEALLDHGVRIFCVTHFYELASRFLEERQRTVFLQAQRLPDGTRTFRLAPGLPEPSGHGRDLYARVFSENS